MRKELLGASAGLVGLAVATAQHAAAEQRRASGDAEHCVTVMVRFRDGSLRPLPAPPTPKVRAARTAPHRVRFSWRFPLAIPRVCQPRFMLLSVEHARPYTPTTISVPVRGAVGAATVREASFLPPGRTGLASAISSRGLRGPVVRVRISR